MAKIRYMNLVKSIIQLGVIPQGWLTILSGFSAVLIGGGSLICLATGLCESPLEQTPAVTLFTGGLAAIGLGRRKK